MRPGRYAVDDGSFARSAGGAGVRGLALLALALLIGIVLLNATDADPPGTTVSASGDRDGGTSGSGDGEGAGQIATTTTAPTTTVPARAPKDVKVIVANASEVKGAAGNAKKALDPIGFNVLAPANAAPVAETSVYFTAGYDRDAAGIAAALGLPGTTVKAIPTPAPFDVKGANVAIVLGADHAPKFAAAPTTATTAAAGAGATTTTAAGAAATTTTAKP